MLVSPIYRFGYYPHNVHFVLTSAQMAGEADTVIAAADQLDAALPMDMATVEGWVQLIKAAPWFARVQFGDAAAFEGILAASAPAEAPAYIEAAWRYARGEAAARLGRPEEARAEAEALAALDAATDWDAAIPGMPGEPRVAIMRQSVLARAAMAEGDLNVAIDHWGRAMAIQAELPYLEPPSGTIRRGRALPQRCSASMTAARPAGVSIEEFGHLPLAGIEGKIRVKMPLNIVQHPEGTERRWSSGRAC
jgi:hypothetical protein